MSRSSLLGSLCRAVAVACAHGAVMGLSADAALAQGKPRTHDGVVVNAVFLRGALGAAYFSDDVRSDDFINKSIANPINIRGTLKAFGVAGQLEIGHSLREGLALGLGVYLQQIGSPKASNVTYNDSLANTTIRNYEYRFDSSMVTLVAPFIDWYPFSRDGLHLGAGAGVAVVTLGNGWATNGPSLSSMHGNGAGVMLDLGYDFWIADGWSLGLLARLLAGAGKGAGPDGIAWSNRMIAPALLVTATMD